MELRVAARSSALSLKQVELTISYIRKKIPNLSYNIIKVKTKGDIVRERPIYLIGSKGVFEKEVNLAVLRGEADIAVHSLKDLPSEIDSRLEIAFVPPRDSPNDALVPRRGLEPLKLNKISPNFIVGTSSPRRRALILYHNDSVNIKDIRGNIDTRIKKLDSGLYDFIVVAEAGLVRLNIKRTVERLSLETFPPAPGQGIIAVTALANSKIATILRTLSDKKTWFSMIAERSFLKYSRAGCNTPLGGVAIPYGSDMLKFIGVVLSMDGKKSFWIKIKDDLKKAHDIGRKAGELAYSIYDKVILQ